MNFLKKRRCPHTAEQLKLLNCSQWFPKFDTSNCLKEEKERQLKLKCTNCGTIFSVKQVMSNDVIMNFRNFQ